MEHGRHGILLERQTVLLEANVTWLRQALAIIEDVSDAEYSTSPASLAPHRVGGHFRHIIEFYECFLDGVESAHIDYDARKRDESIERSRTVAANRTRSIIHRIQTVPALKRDCIVWVRMEDAGATGLQDSFMTSSIGRELQVLSSHTIHHFALIAMTLRAHGCAVDPDFGMAPSTLRYQARGEAA